MKKLVVCLQIIALAIIWFLILPFKFEYSGWRFFGGLHLAAAYVKFSDPFTPVVSTIDAYYSSYWYTISLWIMALVFGVLSYVILHDIFDHRRRTKN